MATYDFAKARADKDFDVQMKELLSSLEAGAAYDCNDDNYSDMCSLVQDSNRYDEAKAAYIGKTVRYSEETGEYYFSPLQKADWILFVARTLEKDFEED